MSQIEMDDRAAAPLQVSRPALTTRDREVIEMWLYGKSERTVSSYTTDLQQFILFSGSSFKECSLADIQVWATHLKTLGRSEATICRKLATLKSLLSFSNKIGYLDTNPGTVIRMPKVRDDLASKILTEDEVTRLMLCAEDERDTVILRLSYETGCRVSELCGLKWSDIRPGSNGGGAVVSLLGKGTKVRNVKIGSFSLGALQALARKEGVNIFSRNTTPVLRSAKGGALSRQQVWRIIKKCSLKAGLQVDVSPHWLRHAHASHSLDHGAPAHLVQQTLGHKSLVTTSRYAHAKPNSSSGDFLGLDIES